jgi:hypothetical protein
MVIAKNTDMGDVEVWNGDYEDCVEFFDANDGMLNGAFLEIVPDAELEAIIREGEAISKSWENTIKECEVLIEECEELLKRASTPFVYGYDDDDLEELPFN